MNIQTVSFNKFSFIVSSDPKELEIKYLKSEFGFSSLHLDDYVNKTQVPKIEEARDYTLVVLDFPYFSANGPEEGGLLSLFPKVNLPKKRVIQKVFTPLTVGQEKRILTAQVDFFIGSGFLVVLHDGTSPIISQVFSECQKTLRKRTEFMEKGPGFLFYRIVDAMVDNAFSVLNEIGSSIDRVDRELVTGQSEKILEDISTTRRNLVFLHTMMKSTVPLFKELEESKHKLLDGDLSVFWGNILDHLQKIWDRIEDYRELIEGISESNESLLSSRTNRIITILTMFSAILLPLNLIASLYGMNIELPLATQPTAFITIVILMIIIGSALALIFKSARWF